MVITQGEVFSIELQSMVASTGFGWCLSGLPEGIVLVGTDCAPAAVGIGPAIQKFCFWNASAPEETEVKIDFILVNLIKMEETAQKHSVSVKIKKRSPEEPSNEDEACGNSILPQNGIDPALLIRQMYGVQFNPLNTGCPPMIMAYGYPRFF